MESFVAIDFETADYGADSACAVGLVKVTKGRVSARQHYYIRPPRPYFAFTYLHGISWKDVQDQPDFQGVWPRIKRFIEGANFLAAHNARFDQSVLYTCLGVAGVAPPRYSFVCTVQLARSVFGIYPTKLPDVCQRLNIPLKHHQALSDAEACAHIVRAAALEGWVFPCPSTTS